MAFDLDHAVLTSILKHPRVASKLSSASPTIILPLPDGTFQKFRFSECSVMAPELAAKFPELRTFEGQGADDPSMTVRFDFTLHGFHAQIVYPTSTAYIEPYVRGNKSLHVCYFKRDYPSAAKDFQCLTAETPARRTTKSATIKSAVAISSAGTLRTYRLACAATGEYTRYFGGTVAAGMSAIVTAINRINGIYESELGIRLLLVGNNNLLVYTNSVTDPYTDNSPSLLLAQNQSNIDYVIGNQNYDIGHVFGTGGGGLASVGVACVSGMKAHGETGMYPPTGDGFWVDYVAHEMGHQFGASHTFNGTNSGCNANRVSFCAYEPGSGSTIMAYAGVCGIDNLQAHSSAYFHSASIEQISSYVNSGAGSSGGTNSYSGNHPPVISTDGVFYAPASTPFALSASGADPDNDALTWCWEERDLGPATALTNSDNGSSPIFRSFPPCTNSTRTFPQLSDILNNTNTPGERLPTTSRTMNFRVTARDNRTDGGGVASADVQVNVMFNTGPFKITAPTTGVSWSGLRTVMWDVAGTTNSPINAQTVKILLSADAGQTFPYTLCTNAPNTGSAMVLLPNISTTLARIKVQPVSGIFFDISHGNFSVAPSSADLSITASVPSTNVSAGANVTCTLRVTNVGPGVASSVMVSNTLPSQMVYGSASVSQGTFTYSNGLLVCSIGVLTNGATAQICFTMSSAATGFMTNRAIVSADSIDPLPANNSASTTLYVTPVHNGPVLPVQADIVLSSPSPITVTNTATDHDIPMTTLTYQLLNPPAGASIDSKGVINWLPPSNVSSGSYSFQTVVTDNGTPRLSATNSFRVSLAWASFIQPAFSLSLSVTNGSAVLSWASQSGLSYRVQYRDSFAMPWTYSTPDIVATNTTAVVILPITSSPTRLFRVQAL